MKKNNFIFIVFLLSFLVGCKSLNLNSSKGFFIEFVPNKIELTKNGNKVLAKIAAEIKRQEDSIFYYFKIIPYYNEEEFQADSFLYFNRFRVIVKELKNKYNIPKDEYTLCDYADINSLKKKKRNGIKIIKTNSVILKSSK